MKKCDHLEHKNAYVDPETGWVITEEEEAWFPLDWDRHIVSYRRETVGRPKKYASNKERYAAGYQRMKAKRMAASEKN